MNKSVTINCKTGFDNFLEVVNFTGAGYVRYITTAVVFSLIALSGFSQSGIITVNSNGTTNNNYVSPTTKFPIWFQAGTIIGTSTNVTEISGVLYNVTS